MEQAEKKFQSSRPGVGGRGRQKSSMRYMRHLSQSRTQFVQDRPQDSFGSDGDIVFWENPQNYNKIEQFVKNEGRWINLSEGRPVSDSATIRKWVAAKTGT